MLVINDDQFIKRAEIIWEKGTNRSSFFRGEVDKYGWVDVGSSFLPSEIVAAFLYAQLEHLEEIQEKRVKLWNLYFELLQPLVETHSIYLPAIPAYASNNAHIFYIIFPGIEKRNACIDHLKANDILSVFHYLSLHKSPYYHEKHDGRELTETERYSDTLLRLPMYYDLEETSVMKICDLVKEICK